MVGTVVNNMNALPVVGSSYFYYTKARFYAGLYGVAEN